MSYRVLALKWRPQIFDDVVGQKAVTRTLQNAIEQDRVAHAFLFSGVRGVGKTTTARILAKALNCADGPTVSPCGKCPSCKEIAASSSMDVLEIDGASHTKVEEMREVLEASRYAPSRDRFKIYVIDEVHMLSMHSFNALLKTLEEPPPHLKFIFATTEYHKIPDTIVSRCQPFEFRTVTAGELTDHLRRIAEAEKIEITAPAIHQIARAAEGSVRDSLSALDQVVAATGGKIDEKDVSELLGLIDSKVLGDAAQAIVERSGKEILGIVDQLVRSGRDLRSFAHGLMQYLRDVLVVRVAPDSPELLELGADREMLDRLAGRLTEEDLIRSLEVLTQLEGALRWSPEPRFHLEVALLKLSELRRLASFEELLARFEAMESGPAPAGPKGKAPTGEGGTGSPERTSRSAGAKISTKSRAKDNEASDPPHADEASAAAPTPCSDSAEELVALLLERLRSVKPKLAALVSHHNGVTLEGDCLHMGFVAAQQFIREQIEQDEFRGILEKEASELLGRPIKMAFGFSEPEKPTEAAPPEESNAKADKAALYERAVKDPMVRRFVETFQGEVEEVRALDRDSTTEK
jgi:DNA polymerase-3 subunit gamma/tau